MIAIFNEMIKFGGLCLLLFIVAAIGFLLYVAVLRGGK